MHALVVIFWFLVLFGIMVGGAMAYGGLIGLVDFEDFVPRSRRMLVFRLVDLLVAHGLIWFCQSVYRNWNGHPADRKSICSGMLVLLASAGVGIIVMVLARFFPAVSDAML